MLLCVLWTVDQTVYYLWLEHKLYSAVLLPSQKTNFATLELVVRTRQQCVVGFKST